MNWTTTCYGIDQSTDLLASVNSDTTSSLLQSSSSLLSSSTPGRKSVNCHQSYIPKNNIKVEDRSMWNLLSSINDENSNHSQCSNESFKVVSSSMQSTILSPSTTSLTPTVVTTMTAPAARTTTLEVSHSTPKNTSSKKRNSSTVSSSEISPKNSSTSSNGTINNSLSFASNEDERRAELKRRRIAKNREAVRRCRLRKENRIRELEARVKMLEKEKYQFHQFLEIKGLHEEYFLCSNDSVKKETPLAGYNEVPYPYHTSHVHHSLPVATGPIMKAKYVDSGNFSFMGLMNDSAGSNPVVRHDFIH